MPLESKSQNRLFRWAKANPDAAAARGIKPKVADEFISASHGQDIRSLPERVGKAEGGTVKAPYPPPFRW